MWTNVIMPLNYQWDELLLLGRSMSKLFFGRQKLLGVSEVDCFNHHLSHWGDRSLGTEQQWCLYGTQYLDRILFHASAPEGLGFRRKPMESWSISAFLCGMKGDMFCEEYDLPVGGSADRVVQSGFLAAFWQIQNISKIWDSKSAMKLHATPDSKDFLRCRL